MKNKSKISFKRSIIQIDICLIVVIAVFIGLYFMLSSNASKKYNNAIQLYSDISGFYDYIEKANFSFKSYLYTENVDDIEKYKQSMKRARDKLNSVKDGIGEEYRWRIDLLNNMVKSYQNAATDTKNASPTDYQSKYNEFLKQYSLLEKTSITYYEYLTDDIKNQQEEIHDYEKKLFIMLAMIMILGIVWLILFSIITIKSFTKPLYQILNNIKSIKRGEYDLSDISNTSIEMENLCIALDDMAQHVQKNIENENLKKDELLALSELKMLQNQINPHFLFNTLNMIYKTAYRENATDTGAMVDKTAMLLRYALDKANKTSDLYSEIESVENYIYIQEKRFHQRINFILNVEDGLPNIQVPGLLIQPLIENAVKHGLKNVIEDGEVVVNIQKIDESVVISVSDNGVGLETDVLEKSVLNDFQTNNEKSNLGLYNVIQRIKMFYGKNASISFNSYPECGFEVIIEIRVGKGYV